MDITLADGNLEGFLGHPLLQGMLEASSDGVLVIDSDSRRVLHMNRRARELLGYTEAEVEGCQCRDLANTNVCVRGCPLTSLIIDGDSRAGEMEVSYRGSGDRLLQAHTRMIVVRDGQGIAIAGIEMFNDLNEVRALETALRERRSLAGIIGRSAPMQELYDLIEQVAPYDLPVLITGESGVGKERVSDALQGHSDRARNPYVKVNCAALSPSLVESELFGHRKGAFTGAIAERRGRFEEADKGTILLDEVGELPLGIQAKLLRCLQEGEIQRVGEDRPRRVDVRVLAATNRRVEDDVADGHFRQDLYYRLAGVRVHVPPLRDRPADIPLLVRHFLERFALEAESRGRGKPVPQLTDAAMQVLLGDPWAGNVRELENRLRLAWIRVPAGMPIGPEHLVQPGARRREPEPVSLSDLELRAIEKAMATTEGNVAAASRVLGIDRTTLWRKLKKLKV